MHHVMVVYVIAATLCDVLTVNRSLHQAPARRRLEVRARLVARRVNAKMTTGKKSLAS